jgi:hypothetical protein
MSALFREQALPENKFQLGNSAWLPDSDLETGGGPGHRLKRKTTFVDFERKRGDRTDLVRPRVGRPAIRAASLAIKQGAAAALVRWRRFSVAWQKADAERPKTRDRRKLSCRARRYEGKNRGRHLAIHEPAHRTRLTFAEFDSRASCGHDRRPNIDVGRRMLLVDRNCPARQARHRFNIRTSQQNGNHMACVLTRRDRDLLHFGKCQGFRMAGVFSVIRFYFRHGGGPRRDVLRKGSGGRRLCVACYSLGIDKADGGMRLGDVGWRRLEPRRSRVVFVPHAWP